MQQNTCKFIEWLSNLLKRTPNETIRPLPQAMAGIFYIYLMLSTHHNDLFEW